MKKLKLFEEFLNEKTPNQAQSVVYKVTCRDTEGTLKKLIEYIGSLGNTGHSFPIVVDPEVTAEEGKKTFHWDGDGSDRVEKVEVMKEEKPEEKEEKPKEEKKEVKESELNEGGLYCIKLKDGKSFNTVDPMDVKEDGSVVLEDVKGTPHEFNVKDIVKIWA